MPSTYTYASLQDAISALQARLYNQTNDLTQQQWTVSELTGYIVEALRTWNALTGFWRAEFTFPTIGDQWWYDLRTQTNSLIPYTITQDSIIVEIENHLLEPPTDTYPLTWTGSRQFSISDILAALQRRQDETLGTTACTTNRSLVVAAIQPRTVLTDDVVDIRRVAWIPTAGFGYVNKALRQSDMWAQRAFNPYYTTAAPQPPSNWMQNTEPPPSFDVDQIPPIPGQYDVLTVNSGPTWDSASAGGTTVPDDWTWVMKWGAMYDLLSRESNAKDALRAEYCKKRYEEGLAFLEKAPTLLAIRVNNVPMAVDAIRNGDDFNPTWQSKAAGAPRSIYTDGNLVAISPRPDGLYSVTASVCQNAPVPLTLAANIQVARDDFDTVIDYAQHLAMFKAGGQEFLATVSLYQKFQKKAAQYNGKLSEMGFFELPQQDISQLEEQQNARYSPGTGPVAA